LIKTRAFLLGLSVLDFFKKIIEYFDLHRIPYMLSGSIAMGIYIVPRATKDIDFVVHLQANDIDGFVKYFEDGYYCSENAVRDAVNRHSIFNIIDHKSGFKADFVVLKNEAFRLTEFERRRKADFYGINIWVVSPEDLLISKIKLMEDTPEHVKKIQQEIWLSKPVEERLRLTLEMNDQLFAFWGEMKKSMAKNYPTKEGER
jgi:hypothetical protein